MKKSSRLAAAAWFALLALSASAQQQRNPIESRLEARKVTLAADGKESLAPAEAVRPGDVIEYTATYRNTGKAAVRNLEATLPIPQDTELVAGSARPSGARASLDSRTFAATPLKRKTVVNGVEAETAVPLREYRALRWYPGELAADQAVTFSARVRVVNDAANPPPTGKASPK